MERASPTFINVQSFYFFQIKH